MLYSCKIRHSMMSVISKQLRAVLTFYGAEVYCEKATDYAMAFLATLMVF